jgi:putative ABC transport system permease protein
MSLLRLAYRNVTGNPFRSVVITLCVMVVSGFTLTTTLILRGSQSSLRLGAERLGADILVVPAGTEARVESALLMGKPTLVWMPRSNWPKIAAIPGVAQSSPQVFLTSLSNVSCCAVSEMFMVVYDPATDFSLRPWLEKELRVPLALGEVVGGSYVSMPEDMKYIELYGYPLVLRGNLKPTGTGLDQTMFMPMETAKDMARSSTTSAVQPLVIPPNSVSDILIKVQPGVDTRALAQEIARTVPGVEAIESPNLFRSFRRQLATLTRGMATTLALSWLVSLVLVALLFSMAADGRRREAGILRALGSTRDFVFQSLLAEALLLALAGGLTGAVLATIGTALFRSLIVTSMGIPFLLPSPGAIAVPLIGGLVLSLVSVSLAALIPALRVSRQDPAFAMRE